MPEILEQINEPGNSIQAVLPVTSGSPKISKLSIIIPAYNEASTIATLLERICQIQLIHGIEKEMIIINDASSDNTDDIIQQFIASRPECGFQYIVHDTNQGKGAAIHKGLSLATGDYCIIQDADLEYDPEEYNMLLKPVLRGDADIVYGSRFMGNNPHRILFFWHTTGNQLLTFFSNIFTNLHLTDAHTCYKLIRTSIIKRIPLQEKRFAFDAELTTKISRLHGLRLYEVGISYYGRTFAEGKKIRWNDALRTVYCIIKYSLFDREYIRLMQSAPSTIQTQSI